MNKSNATPAVSANGGRAPKKSGLSIQKDYKTGKHITYKPAQNKKVDANRNLNCTASH